MEEGTQVASVLGVKRALLSCKGLRVACWKGTKKRSTKKQLWAQAGVNEAGDCVLRCYKAKDADTAAIEVIFTGSDVSMTRLEPEAKEKVFRFGFALKGRDLVTPEFKPFNETLYIYSTTNREDAIFRACIMALAASSLSSGKCRFASEVSNTLLEPDGGDGIEGFRSVSSRSFGSNTSTSSTRRKLGSLLNPFASLRKSRSSRNSLGPLQTSASAAAAVGTKDSSFSEETQPSLTANTVDAKTTSQQVGKAWVAKNKEKLITVVQCCWALKSVYHSSPELFMAPVSQTQQVLQHQIEKELNGGVEAVRPSLSGNSVDLISSILARALGTLQPGLLFEAQYAAYTAFMNRLTVSDLDSSMSPTALAATSNMLNELPPENVFVLQELVCLFQLVRNDQWTLEKIAKVFGPLLIASLRESVVRTREFPFGELSGHHLDVFLGLLRTLLDDLIGPDLFESCLRGVNTSAITAPIPSLGSSTSRPPSSLPEQDQEWGVDVDQINDEEVALPGLLAGDEIESEENKTLGSNSSEPYDMVEVNSDINAPKRFTDYAALAKSVNLDPAIADFPPSPNHQQSSNHNFSGRSADSAKLAAINGAVIGSAALGPTQLSSNFTKSMTGTNPHFTPPSVSIENAEPPPLLKLNASVASNTGSEQMVQPTSRLLQEDDLNREQQLEHLVSWYKSRLAVAPNSRNASLWKQEVREMELELRQLRGLGQGNANEFQDLEYLGYTELEPGFISAVANLWERSLESSADMLMRKTQNGARRKGSLDNETQVDLDPYLLNPLSAVEDSDLMLEKVLMDVNVLIQKYCRDPRALPSSPRLPSTPLNSQPIPASKIKDPSTLLVGLLQENVQLRIELNEYQRGLVQRTQEKALEFKEAFEEKRARDQRNQRQIELRQPQVTSTWASLASLLS